MSYLDIPRIHFSGRFFTDPSTVNNDPQHYEPSVTEPSPWQNPNGQHRFELRNCLVTSAVGPNGFMNGDPVVGGAFSSIQSTDHAPGTQGTTSQGSAPAGSPARIVDIDVYQQGVTVIYGLRLMITVGNQTISGKLDPPSLNQVWFNAVLPKRSWGPDDYDQDSFGGDMNACGVFQSALRFDAADWPETASPVLNLLRSTTLMQNGQYVVSCKLVVDGYRNVPEDSQYQTGRIVGSIGPLFANEPLYNPGQRWLMPRAFSQTDPWNFPSFNQCPFKVDVPRKKLVLDLANSICRQNAGGPAVDLGTLTASIATPEPAILTIGTVDYSAFSYSNNALITEIPLSDPQIEALQKGKLHIGMSKNDIGDPGILIEPEPVVQFAIEQRPIRLQGEPGSTITAQVYISTNGKPLENKQLGIVVESVHGNTPGATVPKNNPGNTPQADGALTASISSSNANGFATITLNVVKDPGRRTPELDGQLYFVIVFDPDQPTVDYSKVAPPQDQMITCLVFSQYTVQTNPTWEEIQAMMAPYMKLYPSMKNLLDLTDLHSFTIFSDNPPWQAYGDKRVGPLGIVRGTLPYYMSASFDDPKFMPISRDLSDARTLTIMHFIKNLQDDLNKAKNPVT